MTAFAVGMSRFQGNRRVAGGLDPHADLLLAIGGALMLGIGLRIAAGATTAMMLLMYLAEWPFAANAGSTNPLIDYHIIYALVAIVVAVLAAGDTWGLGERWRQLRLVQQSHWLV